MFALHDKSFPIVWACEVVLVPKPPGLTPRINEIGFFSNLHCELGAEEQYDGLHF